MALYHLFLLAVIQGVTEFLPVSSSGHLALLPQLTNLADQGLVLDVAVHVGTLIAVVLYFWADVRLSIAGTLRLMQGHVDTKGAFLALCLLIATIPVIIVGLILQLTGWIDLIRSVKVIGWTMLLFGILLYWADTTGSSERTADRWTLRDAILMGLAQAVALIPGTSRSGICITAARKLGYDRNGAAKLSMLMSIPTILASGTLLGIDAVRDFDPAHLLDIVVATVLAFLAALCALALMMRLLQSISFTPYVIYRCVLGVILLGVAYS